MPKRSKFVRSETRRSRRQATKLGRRKPRLQYNLLQKDAFDYLKNIRPGTVHLIVSSPPYCMGKEYESSLKLDDFISAHKALAPLLVKALKPGGSICWQIGHHVLDGVVTPLDAIVYPIFATQENLYLRNRIVWTFGHGVHAKRRFSGRHETILWFTKGRDYRFNLDAVRIPQKYPGKRHYKGPRRGRLSGNPRGKNPSDVWDIPNVKAGHLEKTAHPCQFPLALVRRLIRALTPAGGLVIDPFMGSGSSAVAAALEGRAFGGSDVDAKYVRIAKRRLKEKNKGTLRYRPDMPVYIPTGRERVSQRPRHFVKAREDA